MVKCTSNAPSSPPSRRCDWANTLSPEHQPAPRPGWSVSTATRPSFIIAARIGDDSPILGVVELDESCFGGERKGRRGRGAAGKVPVFGILKRGGRVCTTMIPNARASTLLSIVQEKVELDSVVYTDAFGSYDILDVAGFKHHRINHSKAFAARGGRHFNGIENSWSQAKRHLR